MPAERLAPEGKDAAGQRAAIRPLRAADLDAVGALQEAAILTLAASDYTRPQLEAWARFGWQYRRRLLEDEGAFFVVEEADRLVGVGGWSPDSQAREAAWLRYLFVLPASARRGIGRQLVAAVEGEARRHGKTAFLVWSSLNATGFYEALGYRRVRRGRWPVAGALELEYVLLAKDR